MAPSASSRHHGPWSFWIGGQSGPHLLVVLAGRTIDTVTPGNTPIQVGQRVSIDGAIRRLPATEGDVTVTDCALPEADAAKVKGQQIYVYATRVHVSGR